MALTAAEQYMLEMINRARLDPLGEAARYGIDLNDNLSPGQLHTAARGVLAPEAALERAAIGHSQWMLAQDVFSHTGVNNTTPAQRAIAEGYEGWGAGENISWRGTTGFMNLETTISLQHADLFRSASHRVNILWDSYREVGIAQEAGQFSYNGSTYNAAMLTQNFSSQEEVFYVTGVVFDDLNRDGFYSIGEGRAGAEFASPGDSTTAASAGGYALQVVPGGPVTVTGTVDGRDFSVGLAVAEVNAKLDIVDGTMFLTSADTVLGTGIHHLRLLGTAALEGTGNGMANRIEGNAAANDLRGKGGNDQLSGGAGKDRLFGDSGRDQLAGGEGNDLLRGGDGADTLAGDGGRDKLFGEAGDDLLTGGGGADTFIFAPGAGHDRITDFRPEDGLKLDMALFEAVETGADVLDWYAEIIAGDLVIDFGSSGSLTLDGVTSFAGLADNIELI